MIRHNSLVSPKIAGILERIDAAQTKLKISDRQLSLSVGVVPNLIANLRTGRARSIKNEKMEALSQVLGVDPAYLMTGRTPSNYLSGKPSVSHMSVYLSQDTAARTEVELPQIRLIGQAGAGAFVRVDDFFDEGIVIEGRKHPKFPSARHFAVTVLGDSMDNMGRHSMYDGDIALCVAWEETGYSPRDGDIVLVEQSVNGGHILERTIKQIRRADGGYYLMPRSTNLKHKPIFLKSGESDDGKEVTITGLVYGSNRVFDSRL